MKMKAMVLFPVFLLFSIIFSSCNLPIKEGPPGSSDTAGNSFNILDPQTTSSTSATTIGNNSGLLKPICFVNIGVNSVTVIPWTYVPLNSTDTATPSNASTVSSPGGNTSSCLSLPLGTYTWCYWWEIGDVDGDKILDYRYAIDNRVVVLDASDSDQREFAETVNLAAPVGVNEQVGKCGDSGIQPIGDLSTAENLTIRAYIDGLSQLIIEGDKIYWFHKTFATPGYGYKYPTTLNGVAWTPIWPEPAPSENRDCDCASSKFSGIPPLSRIDQIVKLVVIESRDAEMINIVEQPSASNNYKLVVEIYDYSGGYGWYEFTLEYD